MNTLGPGAANEGVDKAVMREAVLIQMTWPGAPTIYYGDEAGLCGFTDPDNRSPFIRPSSVCIRKIRNLRPAPSNGCSPPII